MTGLNEIYVPRPQDTVVMNFVSSRSNLVYLLLVAEDSKYFYVYTRTLIVNIKLLKSLYKIFCFYYQIAKLLLMVCKRYALNEAKILLPVL